MARTDQTLRRAGRRTVRVGLVLALAVAVAACGDDGDDGLTGGDAFSVAGSLAELPRPETSADELLTVTAVDLDAAADLNGAGARPDPDAEPADATAWATAALGAGDGATVLVPTIDTLGGGSAGQVADVAGELGWSVLDVEAAAEVAAGAFRFGVVSGEVDEGTLDAEGLVDLEDGVVTAGEGDDGEVDVDGATAARPLGVPLRMAATDGRLAVSTSTDEVGDWLRDDLRPLSDDEDLLAIADALDDAEVAAAQIVRGQLFSDVGQDAGELPIRLPFAAVGVGWGADDAGRTAVTVAYAFADADTAEDALAGVREAYGEDTLTNAGYPVANLLVADEVRAEGNVVVATLRLGRDGTARTPADMLTAREAPFTHG